jgi:hypothetical protein
MANIGEVIREVEVTPIPIEEPAPVTTPTPVETPVEEPAAV